MLLHGQRCAPGGSLTVAVRIALTILGAAIAASAALPAWAHTISTLRGVGVIEDGRLTLTLSGAADDYLHDRRLLPVDGGYALHDVEACAARRAEGLLERLIVRDGHGRRIEGRLKAARVAAASERVSGDELRRTLVEYVLEYDVSRAGRYLSFQQRPTDGAGALGTRIAIAVRSAGGGGTNELTLTTGGNVEVVTWERRPPAGNDDPPAVGPVADTPPETPSSWHPAGAHAPCDRRAFVLTDAFKTLRGVVAIEDEKVRVSVYVPAPMIETWMPLPRAERDFLDPAEQDAAAARFARFCAERIRLCIDGSRPALVGGDNDASDLILGDRATNGKVAARFLNVGDIEPEVTAAPARLSYWTSRILVRMEYALHPPADRVDVEWTLFNSVVVVAPVLLVAGGKCVELDVSTYQPSVRWWCPAATESRPQCADGGR
ncbi:MAG: hypothetical protein C4547_05300 [Phycisphaerales bacterium]|nr:MAG: hypothetical protein C4547_05300 [Phycisphaerales bacterium]